MPDNGWEAWGKHVLTKQAELGDALKEVIELVTQNRIEIGMLKVKASIWGGIAGLIPSLGLLIYYLVKNMKG